MHPPPSLCVSYYLELFTDPQSRTCPLTSLSLYACGCYALLHIWLVQC